jgi:DNA segregation ATPase FtsK/SpoIIIE-like protein
MSRRALNKQYLTLSNVRVAYRPKDDTIHLTSTDRDLRGEAFRVTLKPGTESDQILRELLHKKGLIHERSTTPGNLPKFALRNLDSEWPWHIIPIGEGFDATVSFDILTNSTILLVGRPGSGKTVVQQGIIHHCLVNNSKWAVYGVDLKGDDLPVYLKYKNTVREIARTVNETRLMLETLHAEMMRRYEFMESRGLNNLGDSEEGDPDAGDTKALMVIVDEYEILTAAQNDYGHNQGSAEDREEIRKIVLKIVKLGRAAKIHTVISSQHAKNSETIQNCTARIALGKIPTEESYLLFGDDTAEETQSNNGRGVIRTKDGIQKFQAYFSSDSNSEDWVMHRGEKAEPELFVEFNKDA